MKILIGIPSPDSWGGPAASEPPFVDALRQMGVNVTEEVYVHGDKKEKTKIIARVRRVVKIAFVFRRILQRNTFDLIHFNTAFDLKTLLRDTFTLALLPKNKAKIFLKIHGAEEEVLRSKNPLLVILKWYLNKRVDGFGVFTTAEKAAFLDSGFAERKFHFVKNALTIKEDFPKDFARAQKSSGDTFELLFVSRFVPKKSLIETIQACALVRDRGYKFVLTAVGDGETRAAAENEVDKLHLTENVKFTGYIPETSVTPYFFNSDILIFPTRYGEGFPVVFFKGTAAGLPIVSSRFRAAADYLSQPENCLFCEPTPPDLAAAIINLIDDAELRRRMTTNNLAFGESLKPEKIAEEYLEIYRKITGKD